MGLVELVASVDVLVPAAVEIERFPVGIDVLVDAAPGAGGTGAPPGPDGIGCSTSANRHTGHVPLDFNQVIMQSSWNGCPHGRVIATDEFVPVFSSGTGASLSVEDLGCD